MDVTRSGKSGSCEVKVVHLTPEGPADVPITFVGQPMGQVQRNGADGKDCRRKSAEAIVGGSRRAEQINSLKYV